MQIDDWSTTTDWPTRKWATVFDVLTGIRSEYQRLSAMQPLRTDSFTVNESYSTVSQTVWRTRYSAPASNPSTPGCYYTRWFVRTDHVLWFLCTEPACKSQYSRRRRFGESIRYSEEGGGTERLGPTLLVHCALIIRPLRLPIYLSSAFIKFLFQRRYWPLRISDAICVILGELKRDRCLNVKRYRNVAVFRFFCSCRIWLVG